MIGSEPKLNILTRILIISLSNTKVHLLMTQFAIACPFVNNGTSSPIAGCYYLYNFQLYFV